MLHLKSLLRPYIWNLAARRNNSTVVVSEVGDDNSTGSDATMSAYGVLLLCLFPATWTQHLKRETAKAMRETNELRVKLARTEAAVNGGKQQRDIAEAELQEKLDHSQEEIRRLEAEVRSDRQKHEKDAVLESVVPGALQWAVMFGGSISMAMRRATTPVLMKGR